MKINKQELKQIIKEETQRALNESSLSDLIASVKRKGEEFLASPIGQRVSGAAEKVAQHATRQVPASTDVKDTLEWTLKTLNPVLSILSKYQHVISDEDIQRLQDLLKSYTTGRRGKHTTTLPIKDPSQIQDPLAKALTKTTP